MSGMFGQGCGAFLQKSEPPVVVRYNDWLDFNYYEYPVQRRFDEEMAGVHARMHITRGLLESPLGLYLPESVIERYHGMAAVVGQTPQGGLVWVHDLGSVGSPGPKYHFIGIYDPKTEQCSKTTTLEWLLEQELMPAALYDRLVDIYHKHRDLPVMIFDNPTASLRP